MPKIKEDLREISKAVNEINKEAKEAAANTKSLGQNLKLDPNNLDLIKQRFSALGKELDLNTKKMAELKRSQENLEKLKISDAYKNDEKALQQINALLDDYRVKLGYAADKQKELEAATSQTAQNQALINAATTQMNQKFANLEKVARKVQIATLAVVAAMTKVVNSSIALGTELYSLSKRYQTTAEDIQLWNRALQLATGQADLFTNSLSVMVKGMAQIAAGRGVAFRKALANIGIAYRDIKELSAGEQFEAILNGLASVENYSTRAAAAQQLLGESGQYIADVFENQSIDLEEYLTKAQKFGIISQDNAKRLAELGFELEAVKSTLAVAGAELVTSLAPTIEFVGNFLKTVVVPVLNGISTTLKSMGGFGTALLVVGTTSLILLPKIVMWIKQLQLYTLLSANATRQLAAAGVVANMVFGKWMIVLTAIAGVITLVMGVVGALNKEVEDVNKNLDDTLVKTQGLLGDAASDYTVNTEATSKAMTTRYVEISVDIDGHGDTPIGDENAVKVARLTADDVQKSWGDLINQ